MEKYMDPVNIFFLKKNLFLTGRGAGAGVGLGAGATVGLGAGAAVGLGPSTQVSAHPSKQHRPLLGQSVSVCPRKNYYHSQHIYQYKIVTEKLHNREC